MASETYHDPAARTSPAGDLRREPTGWVGWIFFAAVMMIIAGALNAIHGLVAILNDEWVVWGNRADLYIDLTTWGWVHLVIGIAVLLAGFGLLSGNVLARAVAVLVASVSIVANFLFIPAYPVWALTVIAIDVFVIYALTAHGRELA
ncbi:MAG TPA: hypothetical protein VFZ79_05775 [Acidimicrobiales bacterium]